MDYPAFSFQARAASWRKARIGKIATPHGTVETPNFIFCGTKASVKALSVEKLLELKTQVILANTYHLLLQPGGELIEKQGGLHSFMRWPKPLLTDSGGYQVFAMGHGSVAEEIKGNRNRPHASLLKIEEAGVTFRSYLDGAKVFLSPESSIKTQWQLGADLTVQLDECTPYHVSEAYTRAAMERSMRWGDRSLETFLRLQEKTAAGSAGAKKPQALYGVMQGGVYPQLRAVSAAYVKKTPFFGIAIGGSLGKERAELEEVVGLSAALAAGEKPVHLLGIGSLREIFFGVGCGIDTFDCVAPTRLARHGVALLPAALTAASGRQNINLKNASFREDPTPLDETSPYEVSRTYSRAYLHHLLKAKEVLALELLSAHNVGQMNRLMHELRSALKSENAAVEVEQLQRFWCGG